MGDAADLILEGAQCMVCGEWMDDVTDGYDPPGHPRTCRSCLKPTTKPRKTGTKIHRGRAGKGTIIPEDKVLVALDGHPLRVYDNQGAKHFKFYGRFNYWPSREKWWDSITNIKGKGSHSFIDYVRNKVKTLQLENTQ